MNIYEKLVEIQTRLKAPKNNYNSFGKYNYRSCEDILEAVKPLLKEVGAALTISDDIMVVGDRTYLVANATLFDTESPDFVQNRAFAREPLEKKGMDESQITGTASSYARKYCLNGLFCIDDVKDADTDQNYKQTGRLQNISKQEAESLWITLGNDKNRTNVKRRYKVGSLEELTREQYEEALKIIREAREKKQ